MYRPCTATASPSQTADEDGNLTGGYDRKLTFGGVNGGQNGWSADALARWGRPDGKGGKAHVFGDVEFSDCEDAAELKKLTEAQLAKSCANRVLHCGRRGLRAPARASRARTRATW